MDAILCVYYGVFVREISFGIDDSVACGGLASDLDDTERLADGDQARCDVAILELYDVPIGSCLTAQPCAAQTSDLAAVYD